MCRWRKDNSIPGEAELSGGAEMADPEGLLTRSPRQDYGPAQSPDPITDSGWPDRDVDRGRVGPPGLLTTFLLQRILFTSTTSTAFDRGSRRAARGDL